jgi:hypothetical protein
MRPHVDPLFLTPEDRLREIAALLAVGLLRLQSRPAAEHPGPEKPPKSSPNCLELPGETVLSVHMG